jgi:hypothetical protein
LADDVGETSNLIEQYPEVAERLRALLAQSPNQTMVLFDLAPPKGTRYELEAGELSGGAAAGQRDVRNMQVRGAVVAISVDGGAAGGEFELLLAYASGGGASCGLFVNGVEQEALLLPKTGGWQTYKAVKLTVALKPGKNRMEIRSQAKSCVNLDYLELK